MLIEVYVEYNAEQKFYSGYNSSAHNPFFPLAVSASAAYYIHKIKAQTAAYEHSPVSPAPVQNLDYTIDKASEGEGKEKFF